MSALWAILLLKKNREAIYASLFELLLPPLPPPQAVNNIAPQRIDNLYFSMLIEFS